MAAKKKDDKPKIKVVEVSSEEETKDPVEEKVENKEFDNADESKKEDTEKTEQKTSSVPQVTSFSQLDNQKMDTPSESTDLSENKEKKEVDDNKDSDVVEDMKDDTKDKSGENIQDWLKEVRPDTTKDVEKKAGFSFKTFLLLIFIFAVIGALVGGALYYKNGMTKNSSDSEETTKMDEKEISSTQTPTPEPIDLTTYKVSILNGSGVSGAAGAAKDLLVEGGFSEENIEVGNADSSDYENTSVSVKSGTDKQFFEELKNSLGDNYELELSDDELDEDSTYDSIIILGTQLN